MERFQLPSAQILYSIQSIHDKGYISLNQKHNLKDLLLTKEPKIQQIYEIYCKDKNEEQFQNLLIDLVAESNSPDICEDYFSNSSYSSYKNKRPKGLKIKKKSSFASTKQKSFGSLIDLKEVEFFKYKPQSQRQSVCILEESDQKIQKCGSVEITQHQ